MRGMTRMAEKMSWIVERMEAALASAVVPQRGEPVEGVEYFWLTDAQQERLFQGE